MKTKISVLREHMAAGQWQQAISLASRFPRLGEHRNAILDAQGAYTNPRFLVQLGKDPEQLIAGGRAALLARFGE